MQNFKKKNKRTDRGPMRCQAEIFDKKTNAFRCCKKQAQQDKRFCATHAGRAKLIQYPRPKSRLGGERELCVPIKTFSEDGDSWPAKAKPADAYEEKTATLKPGPIWQLLWALFQSASAAKSALEQEKVENGASQDAKIYEIKEIGKNEKFTKPLDEMWQNIRTIVQAPKNSEDAKKRTKGENTNRYKALEKENAQLRLKELFAKINQVVADPRWHQYVNKTIEQLPETNRQDAKVLQKTLASQMSGLESNLLVYTQPLCPTSNKWFGLKQNKFCAQHGAKLCTDVISSALAWAYTSQEACPNAFLQSSHLPQLLACWLADIVFWSPSVTCANAFSK